MVVARGSRGDAGGLCQRPSEHVPHERDDGSDEQPKRIGVEQVHAGLYDLQKKWMTEQDIERRNIELAVYEGRQQCNELLRSNMPLVLGGMLLSLPSMLYRIKHFASSFVDVLDISPKLRCDIGYDFSSRFCRCGFSLVTSRRSCCNLAAHIAQ